ncbi:ethanolamine utilization protein EutM, partial [Brachyspira hampsonii]|nr:ethanolamine utilization protein EutM [Brachyspira hampsonii]MBW5395626.1 ethanolamine utilization protein EutM [Brachyspira hampsonii]
HVIPRPHEEVESLLPNNPPVNNSDKQE